MTIRRQYSLPNCNLILEGINNDSAQTSDAELPLMSILVNAECHFVGSDLSLSGGRSFFENLVKGVNAYAQEFLSGVHHPQETKPGTEKIFLEKVPESNLHRLTWQPADRDKVNLDLTAVQLFDLVEAIDQFFADNYTLPDLSLELQPVSRRYRKAEEPILKRSAPAALGVTTLALSAIAFFFIPVPEIKEPQPQSSPNNTSSPEGNLPPKNSDSQPNPSNLPR